MKYNKTLALIPALLLAACGGEEQTMDEKVTPGAVVYSYPADGQSEISPKSDIVLRFSHAVSDENLANKIRVSDGEQVLPFSPTEVDNGRSLKITLEEPLQPATEYTVTFTEDLLAEGGRSIATPNAAGAEGIQFKTRAGVSGIASLDSLSANFGVAEMIPSPNGVFQPMNMSTFRVRLTHPIHPEWKTQGGIIEITDSSGAPVPATVLAKGRYLTIDPCTTDDPRRCGTQDDKLTAGETYTVSIRNLSSLSGETIENFSQEVTPRDTSPTVVLFQEVMDSGLASGNEPRRSKLNGQIINGVTLNSVLQGIAGPSQQTGSLYAELAYAPSFEADEPLPLRVPKGSILTSTSLDVKINGSVPVIDPRTGQLQKTGAIKVTMLSDATGYMTPNPYTDDESAPRHVKLFMDVSMNTEAAQPNASLSQDLLGVELSGIAIVEDGVLTIDAIGMVEPNLLGQEYTDSTIAFRIEASTDVDSQLDATAQRDIDMEDSTGPTLVSWMPGPEDAIPPTRQDMQRPGDPILLNFDEPLNPASIANGITLSTPQGDVTDLDIRLDGTVLVVNPEGGLDHGVPYVVSVHGVTDLAGNPAVVPQLQFKLPPIEDDGSAVAQQSPFALTTYPGYPCVTEGLNLDQDSHGYCIDKLSEENAALPNNRERDRLPITTLPEDRPIIVVFSQSMNLDSISLGKTFRVVRVSEDGTETPVPGRLEKNNQRIRFYPDDSWTPQALYKYTLVTTPFGEAVADCSTVICGENGRAFQSALLLDPTANGGEPLEIYFRGAETTNTVFTPLRNLPIRDTNSNYEIDEFETFDFVFAHDESGNTLSHYVTPHNAARLAMSANATVLGNNGGDNPNARVGCSYDGADCPESKFIYQTYGLNTEIIGPEVDPATDEKTGRIEVNLYPTMLVTSPATVVYNLGGPSESSTGPQILRMRYEEKTEDNPQGLIKGYISEGPEGNPIFETEARLMLDAPNLHLPLGELNLLAHNLFSYEFTLDLVGDIVFFDDGRMQVEQRNRNVPAINVEVAGSSEATSGLLGLVSCLGSIFTGSGTGACEDLINGDGTAVKLPLEIPQEGVYLNFISKPVKEIPQEY